MVYAYNSPTLKEQTTPVSIYAKDFHYGTSAISNEQFISLWSVVDKIGGEHVCGHPYDVVGMWFQEKQWRRRKMKRKMIHLPCSLSTIIYIYMQYVYVYIVK